LSNF
jgi:hypothetical protein